MTSEEELNARMEAMFPSAHGPRFASNAVAPKTAGDVDDMVLADEERGRVPHSRSDWVVKEDPRRVKWEREVRKYLAKLNSDFGHKITAPGIYEWATGVSLKELAKAEGVDPEAWRGGARWGSANVHLRHINWVLKEYFGKPRKTTIAGHHVGRAYDVRPSFRVRKKKPANITLLVEWNDGVLEP